jgi:hypothetical protein
MRQEGCLFDPMRDQMMMDEILEKHASGKWGQTKTIQALLKVPSWVNGLTQQELEKYKKVAQDGID